MTSTGVRAVEGQKLWTGWTAITVDQLNKVISLNLRDENNLIEYDVGDDEIYVDLQLGDEIRPTSDFPVWVTVWRAITDNGWWMTGTILVAKTTSGDNIKLFYCDDWKLYIDNGTWTFKQIYLKSEVDALILELRQYVDQQLALKQDKQNIVNIVWDDTDGYWLIQNFEDISDWCILLFDSSDALYDENISSGNIRYYDWDTLVNRSIDAIYPQLDYIKPQSYWTGMLKIVNGENVFFPRQWLEVGK